MHACMLLHLQQRAVDREAGALLGEGAGEHRLQREQQEGVDAEEGADRVRDGATLDVTFVHGHRRDLGRAQPACHIRNGRTDEDEETSGARRPPAGWGREGRVRTTTTTTTTTRRRTRTRTPTHRRRQDDDDDDDDEEEEEEEDDDDDDAPTSSKSAPKVLRTAAWLERDATATSRSDCCRESRSPSEVK